MSERTRLRKALICSTALIGGGLLTPTAAFAVSCPNTITGAALAGVSCDFDTGSSVTVETGGSVDGINMTAYAPSSPSFILNDGTITGDTGFVGLSINSSSLSNGISNTGIISAPTGGTGILIANTSTIAGGITNSGTIEAGNLAVYISGSTISGDIQNTDTGHITGINQAGIFFTNSSLINGGILNDGTISGGGNDTGLGILGNTTINGSLINTGTIEASDVGAGVILNNAFITGSITNSGHIESANGIGLVLANVSTVDDGIENRLGICR